MIDRILNAVFDLILGKVGAALDPRTQAEVQKATAELEVVISERIKAELETARDVMVADAQSEGWMTRNARPATVFWSLGIATWIVLIAPALGIVTETLQAIQAIPSELYMLMTVGIGAYPFAKALEKGLGGRK